MAVGVRCRRVRETSVVIVGMAVVTVLWQVLVVAGLPGPSLLDAVSLLLLDAVGVIYGLRGAASGVRRTTWLLVAAGRALSILSNLLLAEASAGIGPVCWWAGTICGLGMYAALAAGVLSVPAARLQGRQRSAFVAEALTVLGGGFMFVWFLVLAPIIDHQTPSHIWFLRVGFPCGDLLLLIAVTAVVLRGGPTRLRRPLVLMICGMILYLVGDLAFDAIGLDGVHSTGSRPATVCILFGSLLMSASTVLQAADAEVRAAAADHEPVAPPAAWTTYFPYAAVGLGFALMLVVTLRSADSLPWDGLVAGMIVMAGAVAARQILSLRESREQNVTDSLTQLANRAGLHLAAERALQRGEPVAVLVIDLDGFKRVNDVHGHATGDRMLTEFAFALRATTRSGDVPARIGGDEFVVLLDGVRGPDEATSAAQRILAATAGRPVPAGEHTLTTRVSIGIALSEPGESVKDLLHRADLAMYQAKQAGTHGCSVYDPAMLERRDQDAALAEDLETVVADGQLRVLYQPMLDLTTGEARGVEALVRWLHPTRGMISPLDFIPIAERTGAITGIGLHVLRQACEQVAAWHRQRPAGAGFYASVNLSPRQLQEPTLVADVLSTLEQTGLGPGDLVLEITESAIVDQETAIPALEALRAYGVRVAIDDFGTGYSSLQYLTRLPVDILKIDRSFVATLDGTVEGRAVTEAIIRLSQALNLRTVAEGIETPEQARELLLLGCDTGQGYLYARPLPAADLLPLVVAGTLQDL